MSYEALDLTPVIAFVESVYRRYLAMQVAIEKLNIPVEAVIAQEEETNREWVHEQFQPFYVAARDPQQLARIAMRFAQDEH
jgi:predicted RNA-binding protein